jgi:hypothetical protein
MTLRAAAVAVFPVFGVPCGSIREDVGFVFCDWAMFHTLGDHEHFARTKPHGDRTFEGGSLNQLAF